MTLLKDVSVAVAGSLAADLAGKVLSKSPGQQEAEKLREVEDEMLPFRAHVTWEEPALLTYKPVRMKACDCNGTLVFSGEFGGFDFGSFERRHRGVIYDACGRQIVSVVGHGGTKRGQIDYSFKVRGGSSVKIKELDDNKEARGLSEVFLTRMTLDPLGLTLIRDTKETLKSMINDDAPSNVWRCGRSEEAVLRIEASPASESHDRASKKVYAKNEESLLLGVVIASALSGYIDQKKGIFD